MCVKLRQIFDDNQADDDEDDDDDDDDDDHFQPSPVSKHACYH